MANNKPLYTITKSLSYSKISQRLTKPSHIPGPDLVPLDNLRYYPSTALYVEGFNRL